VIFIVGSFSSYKIYFFPSFAYQDFILFSSYLLFDFIFYLFILFFLFSFFSFIFCLHSTYCIFCLFPCVLLTLLPAACQVSPSPLGFLVLSTLTLVLCPILIDAARALLCPTCSCIYPNFSTLGLLIALMMEAVSCSETLVNIYRTTWHIIPEYSRL
jgi:hypothetical protein